MERMERKIRTLRNFILGILWSVAITLMLVTPPEGPYIYWFVGLLAAANGVIVGSFFGWLSTSHLKSANERFKRVIEAKDGRIRNLDEYARGLEVELAKLKAKIQALNGEAVMKNAGLPIGAPASPENAEFNDNTKPVEDGAKPTSE